MTQLKLFEGPPQKEETPKSEFHTALAAEAVDSYEAFVNKFKIKAKKTTDDCYTPQEVYNVVLDYVKEYCPQIAGRRILRPFYPGGDYKAVDYTNAVVIDNPPFSILSQIKRFYIENKIPFFLFAPQLTLFSADGKIGGTITYILANAAITYENGAKVSTSFVSNLFGTARIILDRALGERIKAAQDAAKPERITKYRYPACVISGALANKIVARIKGDRIIIDQSECFWTRELDAQIACKKKIFGAAYILSPKATARAVDKHMRDHVDDGRVGTVWELSEREEAMRNALQ